MDSYFRITGAGCGPAPPGPAPPAPPPPPPPPPPPKAALRFGNSSNPTLFAPGMILQRGGAKVWGSGAAPSSTVTVSVFSGGDATRPRGALVTAVTVTATDAGDWIASLAAPATRSAVLKATDGRTTASIDELAFGDVILCGGQSNMGFGMCGANSKTQTPAEAFDMVASSGLRSSVGIAACGPRVGLRGCSTAGSPRQVS